MNECNGTEMCEVNTDFVSERLYYKKICLLRKRLKSNFGM